MTPEKKYCRTCLSGIETGPQKDCNICHKELSPLVEHGIKQGRLVFQQYVLDTPLGTGGYAEVWLGYDLRSARESRSHKVAIKIYKPGLTPDDRGRIRREIANIKAVSETEAESVVSIRTNLIEDGEITAFVMEYVAGTALDRVLQQLRPNSKVDQPAAPDSVGFSAKDAYIIWRRLIEAVCPLHAITSGSTADDLPRRGHRDLKPPNIVLANTSLGDIKIENGIAYLTNIDKLKPVIVDLGSANISSKDVTTKIAITPCYAALEQLQAKSTAAAPSDVFALALIYLELRVGGGLPSSDFARRKTAIDCQLAELTDVSETFKLLLRECLADEPQRRPQTAQELLQRLRAIEEETQVPAPRDVRRRWPLPVMAITLAAVLGTLAYRAFLRQPPSTAVLVGRAEQILVRSLARTPLRESTLTWSGKSHALDLSPVLRSLLGRVDIALLPATAEALGELLGTEAIPPLQDLASQVSQPRIRAALWGTLAQLGSERGCAELRQISSNGDPELERRATLASLRYCPFDAALDEPLRRTLSWALQHQPQDAVARSALCLVAGLPVRSEPALSASQQARAALQRQAASPVVNAATLDSLACLVELGVDEAARSRLQQIATRPGVQQAAAAQWLARLRDCEVAHTLAELAGSDQNPEDVRLMALRGMAECGLERDAVQRTLLPLLALDADKPLLAEAAAATFLRSVNTIPQDAGSRLAWSVRAQSSDLEGVLATPNWEQASSQWRIPAFRVQTAMVMATGCGASGWSVLARLLKDADPRVRSTALDAVEHRVLNCERSELPTQSNILPTLHEIAAGSGGRDAERARVLESGLQGESAPAPTACAPLSDARSRVLCVWLSRGDAQALLPLLGDSNEEVQIAAAYRLAQAGRKEGWTKLQQALAQGRHIGWLAISALLALGRDVELPADFSEQYGREDLPLRYSFVVRLRLPSTRLSDDQLWQALSRARRDRAAVVRVAVATIAFERYQKSGQARFLNLLNPGLLFDPEKSVVDRVEELLARLNRTGAPPPSVVPQPPAVVLVSGHQDIPPDRSEPKPAIVVDGGSPPGGARLDASRPSVLRPPSSLELARQAEARASGSGAPGSPGYVRAYQEVARKYQAIADEQRRTTPQERRDAQASISRLLASHKISQVVVWHRNPSTGKCDQREIRYPERFGPTEVIIQLRGKATPVRQQIEPGGQKNVYDACGE